ncbi:MAG: hypothetical protein ACE5HK_08300 [Candidatus Methylomirabilales bacterium]
MHKVRFKDGRELVVGKILCLGQNYRKHVEEMKGRTVGVPEYQVTAYSTT